MTTTLEAAFAEVAKLPPDQQDAFAAWILAELAADARWNALLDATPDRLDALADEALAEFRSGRTQPLDPEAL